MAEVAQVGCGTGDALSVFIIYICAVGKEASDFHPGFGILDEFALSIDPELRVETVAFGPDIETGDPHGGSEGSKGSFEGSLGGGGHIVQQGEEEVSGGFVIPGFFDCGCDVFIL